MRLLGSHRCETEPELILESQRHLKVRRGPFDKVTTRRIRIESDSLGELDAQV